ncbi:MULTISPECIES: I78 family peptidase inhibitor [unclassified Pseudomonas]|uniref:I78 family peptidase inhibitor n=1 Tax=unclassified Pseudomonas TaxID=196821 RepID=UPI000BD9CA66|nr:MULTISPECIES: I78 family peptidase inhibitor [unclassified Pseudomonas]PVZ13833.1 peptidase inhibitor I78 family protein [Pseudomonas sp. URIL14HWK12:I12]PVZ24139.1 peptidase inhibitor I78 family protein [Pseudomonas sp. URIL14HWK12:I10]PVZ33222.1 peptidase inhibitor I78 family protein [Pseudomonas sp. URIL14HWK12:I11]SNZ10776.1 Peptidase inhibitor I78 family protein [Pseudomonas sp. URIL14HWK12:I9]
MPCTRFTLLALASFALLSGCAGSSTDTAGQPASSAQASASNAGDGRCNAPGAQYTVGQVSSQALLDQARVRSGSQVARVLGPRDMITMDYRSDRLTLYVDDAGKVLRANCG